MRVTARFTEPFRFLDFLRELRDMVYDEIWATAPSLHRRTLPEEPSPLIDIIAGYPKQIDNYISDSRCPPWLCVNQEIFNEGVEQFFRKSDCQAKIPSTYFTTRIMLSSIGWQEDIVSQMEDELRRLPNQFCTWIPELDYSYITIEAYKARSMDPLMLKKLELCLRTTNGQKTLHITFSICLPHAQTVLGVDLSKLVEIGFTVNKIVLNVICITQNIPVPAGRVQHILSE